MILLPAILELCGDPVAAVRRTAALQVGRVLSQSGLLARNGSQACDKTVSSVAGQVCGLAWSSSFQQRVSYAHAFGSIAQNVPSDDVCNVFLPAFMDVAHDLVLDVRLVAVSTLLGLIEQPGHRMLCAEHDAAASISMQPDITIVLHDVRLQELVQLMTADSDVAIAHMARSCKVQLMSRLQCE